MLCLTHQISIFKSAQTQSWQETMKIAIGKYILKAKNVHPLLPNISSYRDLSLKKYS